MPETLYICTRGGDVLTIGDVTAMALDNTLTIKPGDYYRNAYLEQTNPSGTLILTNELGDVVTPNDLKSEAWLASMWKFTRGTTKPILYIPWSIVDAICNGYPDAVNEDADIYLPLNSGRVAVFTGLDALTTSASPTTHLTVYPGDYYRNDYLEQTVSGSVILTNQLGDTVSASALNSEKWAATHYAFTRTGLPTLYAPWSSVHNGPCSSYPNT